MGDTAAGGSPPCCGRKVGRATPRFAGRPVHDRQRWASWPTSGRPASLDPSLRNERPEPRLLVSPVTEAGVGRARPVGSQFMITHFGGLTGECPPLYCNVLSPLNRQRLRPCSNHAVARRLAEGFQADPSCPARYLEAAPMLDDVKDKLGGTRTALVTGAGGFIGGHLVARAAASRAREVRAVDVKPLDEWYQRLRRTSKTSSPTCR